MKATQPTIETWLPVVGYEGRYEVSDQGRVRSLDRYVPCCHGSQRFAPGRLLAGTTAKATGYTSVYVEGAVSKIHWLVMEAFVGPRPEGMIVCHFNGDPSDNRIENLRYDTHASNMRDSVRHGTHNHASRTHCPQGHPYDDENTHMYQGRRYCRACHRAQKRKRALTA